MALMSKGHSNLTKVTFLKAHKKMGFFSFDMIFNVFLELRGLP